MTEHLSGSLSLSKLVRRLSVASFLALAPQLWLTPAVQAQSTFDTAQTFTVGDRPRAVPAGDLDGDGDLDLAVANAGSDSISVLKNNGDGTFALAQNFAVGDFPNSIAPADLDGDGDLDLAVANFVSNNISVLKNNGDGTFALAQNFTAGDGPSEVIAGDLDGDGDLDLATVNNRADNASVLKNTGDGTFTTTQNIAVGTDPESIAAGDLDGDGDLDLAAVNRGTDNISVLKNNGTGRFAAAQNFLVGNAPLSLLLGDLDGDEDLDVAVTNSLADTVSILKNNGDGTFTAAQNFAVGDFPYPITGGDLDGDNDLDLVTGSFTTYNVSVLDNNGDGTFATVQDVLAGDTTIGVTVGDLDGDGDQDVVTANYGADNISVLKNITAPTLGSFTPDSGLIGSSVTITGTNFAGTTAVLFNGINATFTVNSVTQITATVPTGATTGPIAVTIADGTATSLDNFIVIVPTPEVILSATPSTQTVIQGQSTTYSIDLDRNGFTGLVDLAVSDLPLGATASFSADPTTDTTSTLTITTSALTPFATSTLTITGTASDATVTSTTVTLTVTTDPNADPEVVLNITPSAQAINLGQSANYALDLTRTNFTGPLDLVVTGLPMGTTATFDVNPIPEGVDTATLTIATNNTTHTGAFELIVTALAPGVASTPDLVQLTLKDPVAVDPLATPLSLTSSGLITIARLRQQVTVENTGSTALAGPVYLELTGLTPGVVLQSQIDGVQNGVSVNGNPLVLIKSVGETFEPGESITLNLEFDNQTPQVLSFEPLLVTASGQPQAGAVTLGGLVTVNLSRQQVTITNTTALTQSGPLYLSINDLTIGATLNNSTAINPSNNAPMIGLLAASLDPGSTTTVLLEFVNPTPQVLSFTPELVQGANSKPRLNGIKKRLTIQKMGN